MFCILWVSTKSVGNVTFTKCGQDMYYNSLAYECRTCTINNLSTSGECVYKSGCPNSNEHYEYNGTTATCEANYASYVGNLDILNRYLNEAEAEYSSYFLSHVKNGYHLYFEDKDRQIIANFATVKHDPGLNLFQPNPVTAVIHDYTYWLNNTVFFTYNTGGTQSSYLDQVLNEHNLFEQPFIQDEDVNFYVGRFTKEGEFKGVEKLDTLLQLCTDTHDIMTRWQKFGNNYYASCNVNLYSFMESESTDLYDLFLQDGVDEEGNPILKPIPIVDMNIQTNSWNENFNRLIPQRRFFMLDNYSVSGNIQYPKRALIRFEVNNDKPTTTQIPYLFIEYETSAKPTTLDSSYIIDQTTNAANPRVSFTAQYTMSTTEFWRMVTIVFTVFMCLSFVLFIATAFLHGRTNGEEGLDAKIIGTCVAYLLEIIGDALYLIVFILTFYYMCFFKLQKQTHTCLPEESDFKMAIDVIWAAFAFKTGASLIQIYFQSHFDILLVDWETPHESDVPVSTWRRINISKEWNRILTTRSYSVEITLVFMVFFLSGLNWDLFSQPVPTTELIDVGMPYDIIRIALSTSLFFVIVLVQYLWNNVIYWRFLGNPFYNFLDICSNANVSVLLMMSPNHGHYLHGRSLHSHADVTMANLNENLEYEANGLVGERGLLPNTKEQVFEVFLAQAFRQKFRTALQGMQVQTATLEVVAKDLPASAVQSATAMNKLLRDFFDGSLSDSKFQVIPKSFIHQIFGYSPPVANDTLLVTEQDTSFKEMLLSGIEMKLVLTYMLMFSAIYVATGEPAIAAFIVYIIDCIFVFMFRFLAKKNLAAKSLLDDRFIK